MCHEKDHACTTCKITNNYASIGSCQFFSLRRDPLFKDDAATSKLGKDTSTRPRGHCVAQWSISWSNSAGMHPLQP